MIDPYLAVKWVHVVSSTILFGTGLGTALHMWLSYRSGDVRAIAVASRNTVLADWLFTLPTGILQPVSGVALIDLLGYAYTEPWLVVVYHLYVVAGGCWIVVVVLQLRLRRIAAEALRAGTGLPDKAHAIMRLWFWLGWPAFISLLAIFWLMVAKPQLW